MIVNNDNYYTTEVNKEYMSFHTWLSLHGCDGIIPCEEKAMAILNGTYIDEDTENSKALKMGSYVDAYFEGTLDKYKANNPDVFTQKGELKADYKLCEKMIARCLKSELFMDFMSGEKQKIFTTEMFGCKWKCKLDSYVAGKCIVDLKTTRDIHKQFYVKDVGHVDFISYYGYVYQLAIYQEIVRRETGEKLPCFICAVSKSQHPEVKVIWIDDFSLADALKEVENSCENTSILDVWRGNVEPLRCGSTDCNYCIDTEVLEEAISYRDLIGVV